jgi:hypothetical protein
MKIINGIINENVSVAGYGGENNGMANGENG